MSAMGLEVIVWPICLVGSLLLGILCKALFSVAEQHYGSDRVVIFAISALVGIGAYVLAVIGTVLLVKVVWIF